MTQDQVRFNYGVSAWCTEDGKLVSRRVTAKQIVAEYARQSREIPAWLAEVLTNGIRYSFQDFDALSGAMTDLGPGSYSRIGTLEA